jgi:O-acetyl-ADP-ribose deacetylase (regulator of RNase III)
MATGHYVRRFKIDDQHSVHIYQGSLVEIKADALVSSDDNYLSAGGGVSAALAQVAGHDVYRERSRLAQKGPLRLGDVVRTSGGGLPCRYLYHAITIKNFRHCMDEATLRVLVANLLDRATEDGVRTLGMPALGTGFAGFDIAPASQIIIEELLARLVDTPIRHVILALIGDEAERLFYEQLVRAYALRCAASSLRRIEKQLAAHGGRSETPTSTKAEKLAPPVPEGSCSEPVFPLPLPSAEMEQVATPGPGCGPTPAELAEESGEEFHQLADTTRLAATPANRPKLVAGLAALLLKHADPTDIKQELLSLPECSYFRGTLQEQLMEFLYLSEKNLRTALGPCLFKAKDLRQIAEELGEDCEPARDPEQLIDLILRALCFNILAPPTGLTQYVAGIGRYILDLEAPGIAETPRIGIVVEAAKVLEQVLKDLLRLYGLYLFESGFEREFVQRKIVRGDGAVSRVTLGEARQALIHLEGQVKKDTNLLERLARLGGGKLSLLPARLAVENAARAVDCREWLRRFIKWRNDLVHLVSPAPEQREVREQLEHLRAFLLACRADGVYPEVLRYEGLFENRNGERFVYFLDERNTERKVRTDEKIDPRRHYYCFATNNPLHLFPVLVQKL